MPRNKQTSGTCTKCSGPLIKMPGYLLCQKCGRDLPLSRSKYDGYWTPEDESQVMEELDIYFYQRYPQFENI